MILPNCADSIPLYYPQPLETDLNKYDLACGLYWLLIRHTYTYNSSFFNYLIFAVKDREEGGGLRGMYELLIRFPSHKHTHALGGGNTPHSVSIAPPPGGLHGLWWKTNNKHKSTNVETWNVRSRANHIRTEKLALAARGTQFRSFVDKTRANVNGVQIVRPL